MCAPRSPPSDNFFKFKVMRNRVGPENFLESRLTPFILNNILASMSKDMGISLRFLPERAPKP